MSIFYKLKNFILSIFNSPKKLCEGLEDKSNIKKIDSFADSLQKDVQKKIQKKDILNEIDNNPDLIDTLPYTRLVQLNKLYEERINELENIIKMKKY